MTTIQHGQTGLNRPIDLNARVFEKNEGVLFALFRESLPPGPASAEGPPFHTWPLDGPAG